MTLDEFRDIYNGAPVFLEDVAEAALSLDRHEAAGLVSSAKNYLKYKGTLERFLEMYKIKLG